MKRLVIDGAHGEGGGQIVRSAVTLAAITGRALRIENIRAGRKRPGLAAQHVTAIRAVAAVCRAAVAGDELDSRTLDFAPGAPPQAGDYAFDVAAAREGGSAGAAALVLQSVLPPLALAKGASRVTIQGGTHMAWSPPFDYLRDVWLPALRRIGIEASVRLAAWGWFPIGRGAIEAAVAGRAAPRALELCQRGALLRVRGRAVVANLPVSIAERMAERARLLLAGFACDKAIAIEAVSAACPGAGLFLTADYEALACGFSGLGKRGKPAEDVAADAVGDFIRHYDSGAALDRHLADQMLLPLALAQGPSRFTTEAVTRHLATNAWLIERFGHSRVVIEGTRDRPGLVRVEPAGASARTA